MYAYLDSLINNLDFADNLLNELNEAYQEDPSAFFIIFKECLVNYAQEGKLVEIGVLPEILITEGPARPLEFPAVETINNKYAWEESEIVARKALTEPILHDRIAKENALYYHAVYVNPGWRGRMITKIGNHVFYGRI